MQIYRVDQIWQLALVYQVRISVANDLDIPLPLEFNENYGEKYQYVLVMEDDIAIATCRLNTDDPNYGKIERVSTKPEYQGKGYGSLGIIEAEKWLSELGYSRIVIHSKYSASGFYKKLGYQANINIELDYGPDRKRQVFFEKELEQGALNGRKYSIK